MRHDSSLRVRFCKIWVKGSFATIVVVALAFVIIASCSQADRTSQGGVGKGEKSASMSAAPASLTPSETNPPHDDLFAADRLSKEFSSFVGPLDAILGIVAAPVGRDGPIVSLGQWQAGAAWSTSKVPLVLAALDNDPEHQIRAAMRLAITQSDNTAADQVWQSLGPPSEAAAKVDKVLRDFGDPTNVESRRVRGPSYSAFGQTIWSLANQAKFLAAIACSQKAVSVLDLMQQIEPGQRWGLGAIPDTKFKGGWGPSEDGSRYLLRQFGIVSSVNGLSAVAIAADVNSSSYDGAIPVIDALADWISSHLVDLPAGICPSRVDG